MFLRSPLEYQVLTSDLILALSRSCLSEQDLDKANIKSDVRTWYSKGDLKNMTQLLKYQSKHMDESQERVNQIKEIEKKLAVIE